MLVFQGILLSVLPKQQDRCLGTDRCRGQM